MRAPAWANIGTLEQGSSREEPPYAEGSVSSNGQLYLAALAQSD